MTLPHSEPSSDFARFAAALDGQYTLECEIGRGGMGVVYRAHDLRLDRRVAIKTLPPHLANDSTVRERFLREARTAGGLSHSHIVPVHRADELSGHVFFVMGYVDGESLAQRIRDRGPLEARETARVLRDVSDALGYAHRRGVIHRDVKAENILLDAQTGQAMVTDFGIARLIEAAPLTATGQVLGTVYYLSPEQVSGEHVDARSDIYSLGVVGFFALTGRFPFDAELASAVLIAQVNKQPPLVRSLAPHVPRALGELVDRCLRKDPGARFDSCEQLSRALAAVDFDDVPAAPAPSTLPLVSDTEAHRILGRAAELQMNTGIEPRPAAVIGSRDAARDAERTSGHRALDLRDAALEAGISAKYVDHAMVEHGLTAPANDVPAAAKIVDHTDRTGAFFGTPMRFEYEVGVQGEMPPDDLDLVVDLIRGAMAEPGLMTTVGRAFSWASDPRRGKNVEVSILPRAGKTRIRVIAGMQTASVAAFLPITALTTMGGLVAALRIGIKLHEPLIGLLVCGGAMAVGYGVSRLIASIAGEKQDRKIRALVERLTDQVRESIDSARRLPPGDERTR